MGDPKRRFILHAVNVHVGGGAMLLRALLAHLPANSIALLDTRMAIPEGNVPFSIKRIIPSIFHRFAAELWLTKNTTVSDVVLCFGNLPPLFKLKGRTILLIQNRYLVDPVKVSAFPLKVRMRIGVERLWLKWKAGNTDAFIVQTESMENCLHESKFAKGRMTRVVPFIDGRSEYRGISNLSSPQDPQKPFIYVASGEPHKNHRNLILAWCRLAQEGFFPALSLTLDAKMNSDLYRWIEQQTQQFGLKINNLGLRTESEIASLYTAAQALIYPSTFESFGLPLIEAKQAGLPVLASELDFVRDMIDPIEVFDPNSPRSIARAVKRFMKIDANRDPLVNAEMFLKKILNENSSD